MFDLQGEVNVEFYSLIQTSFNSPHGGGALTFTKVDMIVCIRKSYVTNSSNYFGSIWTFEFNTFIY